MLQPPALEAYSDMPLFNTKAVVRQTLVPAPTLRAWERRYGILTPQRGENDYRLYSERDIATIIWLRERVRSGMTISQAIAVLNSLEVGRHQGRKMARHQTTGAMSGLREAPTPATPVVPPASPPIERYAVDQLRSLLLEHLVGVDERGAEHILAQALAVYPVEDVCLDILTPVLHELGRRWARGELNSTIEHFSASLVRAQLESLFRSANADRGGPLVFVGCAPGELHELGALMLALVLRRGGFRVVYLGQTTDEEGLVATIAALRPAALLLSAARAGSAARLAAVGQRLRELGSAQPLFVIGGQAFEQSPELASQVAGAVLGGSAGDVVRELRKRLSV